VTANTSLDLEFNIGGYSEVMNAIRQTEPAIKKKMDKQIRDALNITKKVAKSTYPAGDWVVKINKKSLFGSIQTTPGSAYGVDSWANAPAGAKAAIFEFIGTKYSGDRSQVLGTIKSLNDRYGQPGRFLWGAWDYVGDEVLDRIGNAVKQAERELQASLDAAGESY
jgi:hypothetical protein